MQVLPELVLAGTALVVFVLAASARLVSKPATRVFWAVSLVGLVAALGLLVWNPYCSLQAGKGCPAFLGMLALDPLAAFFRGLAIVATIIGVVISQRSRALPRAQQGEYHGLLLVLAFGLCLLASANHLLMIYLAMEAVSLCSYLLTGWDRERLRSREAAVKYVLYGGVASALMLFGMSLLFGLTGGLELQQIHRALAGGTTWDNPAATWTLMVALVMVLCGLGYKIAAVPFHMWSPDAYEGAPTPFTALLSVAPKAAGFAVLMRFFWGLFLVPGSLEGTINLAGQVPWLLLLGIISAVTMTLGNLIAIVQDNLKRMLAYSSIAHAGYMLMGVVAGSEYGFQAVSLYLAVYLIMNMGAFAVVAAVENSTGSEQINTYRGLGSRAPMLAAVMAVFLVSLTGLPPTAGFIGKYFLFVALLRHGGGWYVVLAVIGVLNSVVSLYYYARVLRAMYLEKPVQDGERVSQTSPAAVVAALLSIPVVLCGIFWQPLERLASWSAVLFH
ncbi:MAG: NADH-quinone oxidoreductase subunit N [Deltaproteobacteria bacterium]|nr:MAG: NADH-quinone oxidoreductase subunit N [Deltaproteobacteria bacterium]